MVRCACLFAEDQTCTGMHACATQAVRYLHAEVIHICWQATEAQASMLHTVVEDLGVMAQQASGSQNLMEQETTESHYGPCYW